jgi:hypothetical protein
MQENTADIVPKPTFWRMALVYCLFVGISGGTMALLGQRPLWPAFSGIGLVFVLGMRKRWERSQARTLS